MDALAALKLQIEWGADEALADAPVDRFRAPAAAAPRPVMVPSVAPQAPAGPARPVPTAPRRGAASATRAEEFAAAAATIEGLAAALAAFDGCALRDTAASLVFGEGEAASGLMLVGDAPGDAEEREGRPFAGADGALLDRMLASIGLSRATVRIGMVVPWRPPGAKPPSEAEVAACLPFLLRHIALVRPRRLLLLGPLAARALLPPSPAARRPPRGEWVPVPVPGLADPIPGLVSAGPAIVRAKPADRRRVWADLRLVRRALDSNLTDS